MMRSYQFGKPSIGGEHGIEHVTGDFLQSPYINGKDNGVKDVNVNDPGFRWDRDGIHFHNWLWGTAMGGMSSATGMWWYVNDSHRHYLALSAYMAASASDFVLLDSYKSTTPGDPITSDTRKVYAFGKKDSHRAYVYIMNADHCLSRMIRDRVTPTPQDATIQIMDLAPGVYQVNWWNTYYIDITRATSPILRTENLKTDSKGTLELKVTGLVDDVAIQIQSGS